MMDAGSAARGAGVGLAGEVTRAATPHLELDGFSGPLEALLTLARAHRIDLRHLSLPALVEQLVQALQQRTAALLGEKADWLVMAAWLALLRTRLLLPEAREHGAAAVEAERLRSTLLAAGEMQALATWLAQRRQLGRDVFARGQPEVVGVATAPEHELDVVEFLWAALELFEDGGEAADTASVYRPAALDLYPVQDARARVLGLLALVSEAQPLARLLPDEETVPPVEGKASQPPRSALRRRSAWSSTFAACLELAKQGAVTLAQEGSSDGGFGPVLVGLGPAGAQPGTGSSREP